MDVWTPFGDCGVDFQTGETYLVFANDDEESAQISTDSCSGTRRVSDAGGDLAYLYFYEDSDGQAARLDGFVTTNSMYHADAARTQGAVAGAVVELKGEHGVRYAATGADGRFLFDGIAAGEYTATVYASGYPGKVETLAGPQRMHINAKACAETTLLVFKPPGQ